MLFSNAIAVWLSWLVCWRQILIVRFEVRILLLRRNVFRLDNAILTKIEIYLKKDRSLIFVILDNQCRAKDAIKNILAKTYIPITTYVNLKADY